MSAKTKTEMDPERVAWIKSLIHYDPPRMSWRDRELQEPAKVSWSCTSHPTPEDALVFAKELRRVASKVNRVNAKLAASGKLAEG